MFAERRTDKVKGRIIFLIVSITTIKEAKKIGVPKGTKCEKDKKFLKVQLNKIIVNQKGMAKVIEKIKWLGAVKIYENNPNKLFSKINKKIV